MVDTRELVCGGLAGGMYGWSMGVVCMVVCTLMARIKGGLNKQGV